MVQRLTRGQKACKNVYMLYKFMQELKGEGFEVEVWPDNEVYGMLVWSVRFDFGTFAKKEAQERYVEYITEQAKATEEEEE